MTTNLQFTCATYSKNLIQLGFCQPQYLPGNCLAASLWYGLRRPRAASGEFRWWRASPVPALFSRSPCLRHRDSVTRTNRSQTSVHTFIHHRYGNYTFPLPKRSAHDPLHEAGALRGTDYKKASVDSICALKGQCGASWCGDGDAPPMLKSNRAYLKKSESIGTMPGNMSVSLSVVVSQGYICFLFSYPLEYSGFVGFKGTVDLPGVARSYRLCMRKISVLENVPCFLFYVFLCVFCAAVIFLMSLCD